MTDQPAVSRLSFAGRSARLWSAVAGRLDDLADRAAFRPGLLAWATRFPLTRPVARRRAGALFDLCAGFVYSQVLVACVRLRLFEALRRGERNEVDLARGLDLPLAGMRRLLVAASALRLVKSVGPGRYRLGPLGRAVVIDPGIAAMVEHHGLLYGDLPAPVALLSGETPSRGLGALSAYAETGYAAELRPERTAAYTKLMAASQAMVAREVVAGFPFRGFRRLLDVGGGDGSFLEAVATAAPDLDLVLFDLPAVAAEAAARFARAGLATRAMAVGGDFRHDALPSGADVVSLVRVLHDHDDEDVTGLLSAVWQALTPGGTVLVAEPMAGTAGAERVGGAYFGFYLLAMGQGRARSPAELGVLLRRAGFVDVERRCTSLPLVVSLLVARRPAAAKEV